MNSLANLPFWRASKSFAELKQSNIESPALERTHMYTTP